MPQHKDAKKRRRTFFARIPSTFTNKLSSVCSITDDKKMLHSKSTYFYRWGSRGKKLSSKVTFLIPSVCGLALLVGGIVAVNPTANQKQAYAYDVTSGGVGGGTGTESGDITPSIALSFPTTGLPEGFNNNAEQVTTANAGEVAYRSNYFDITVDNTNWYAVLVRAADGYTSELRNGDASVRGVGNKIKPNNFRENTWGYAVTDITNGGSDVNDETLEYSTIPDSMDVPVSFGPTGFTNYDNATFRYKISFAALLGTGMQSGHYTSKVVLSAVTNPSRLANAFGVTTMQEMGKQPEVCAQAEEGATAQLLDSRDDKFYWVTKMKDGNCWMTQNLDFDIPEKLYADTSDVSGTVTTNTQKVEKVSDWITISQSQFNKNDYNAYFDPGDYIYEGPDGTHARGKSCDGNTNKGSLANCEQFASVSATSDMHYHVGNYYSSSAATVKSADNLSNGVATLSICPAGWALPEAYQNGKTNSFYALAQAYGLLSSPVNGNYSIYGDPMYLVYSGYIYAWNGTTTRLEAPGYLGYYQSSTAFLYSSNDYYIKSIEIQDNIRTYDYVKRYFGLPARCLLRKDS